ncbi:hypothetical protein OQA88_5189 [Cercophora sp. LCS_1]
MTAAGIEPSAPDILKQPIIETVAVDNEPSFSNLKAFGIWFAVVLGVICPFLGEGIIATAIPQITNDFKSLGEAGWYASAYLTTLSASQLAFGQVYSLFSPKRGFLASLFIFELGSLICALSPTSRTLILGRAMSGIGAAGLMSGAMALFGTVLPQDKLPLYIGAMGFVYGIASVVSPILGGVITQSYLGWRWCFWVNLPVAVPPVVAVLFVKGEGRAQRGWWERVKEVDFLGMILLVPGVVGIVVGMEYGGGVYGWSDKRTVAVLVAAGVVMGLFAVSQWWRGDRALVPPRVVGNPVVLWGSAFSFCIESSFLVLVFNIPLWFQSVQGLSAGESGVRWLALCVPFTICVLTAGALVTRTGFPLPLMVAGTVLLPLGSGLLSTLTVTPSNSLLVAAQILAGIGVGISTDQPGILIQSLLNQADAPIGIAVLLFCQNLGPAIFVTLANAVFAGRLAKEVTAAFPTVDAVAVASSGATGFYQLVRVEDVPALLEIFNRALTRTFVIAAGLAAASLVGLVGIGKRRTPKKKGVVADDVEDPVKDGEVATEEPDGTDSLAYNSSSTGHGEAKATRNRAWGSGLAT